MCQDRRVFDAMAMDGTPCPYRKKKNGEEAYKMWQANPQKMPTKVEIDNERTQAKEELKTGLTIGGPLLFWLLPYNIAVGSTTTTTPPTRFIND